MDRSFTSDKDSFHSCAGDDPSSRPPRAQRPKSLFNNYISGDSRSPRFPEETNDQLEIEKLQIGSPGKRSSLSPFRSPSPRASISPQPPMSMSSSHSSYQTQQQPWLWKDYPYVNKSASSSPLSQNSYCSYAGSNALARPPQHYLLPPNSGQSTYSSFNNYRSSAVADIFGGRSKSPPSPHPLLSPSRLSPPGGMFSSGYGAKMHCGGIGVYYHHQSSMAPTMTEIWNLMDNPISRSSSQSSGFISQLELDPDRLTPTSPPGQTECNFPPSIYPGSTAPDASLYSTQGPFSVMSGSMRVHHRQQQILIGASSSIRSRQSGTPANTCSRFGPRTSSSSLGKYENVISKEKYEVLFSEEDDDDDDKQSFKTAKSSASMYSLENQNGNGKKNNRRIGRSLKSNLFSPRNQIQSHQHESAPDITDDEGDDEGVHQAQGKSKKLDSSYVKTLHRFFTSIFLFLTVVLMFWVIFGPVFQTLDLKLFDVPSRSLSRCVKWLNLVFRNVTRNFGHNLANLI